MKRRIMVPRSEDFHNVLKIGGLSKKIIYTTWGKIENETITDARDKREGTRQGNKEKKNLDLKFCLMKDEKRKT